MNQKYTRGSGPLEGILAKLRAKKARSIIKNQNGRILDIGCGSYPYFLTTTTFSEKYGIDPSLVSAKIGEDLILTKQRVDEKKLPFDNNFFDVVTMLAVFEHIDSLKLEGVLKEIERVLKPGGILVITTPAPWLDKPLHILARTGLISKEEIHEHKHNLSRSKIKNILSGSGFDDKKIRSGYFELNMNMWFKAEK